MEIKWSHLLEALNRYADRFIEIARENLTNNDSIASQELYDSLEKIVEIGEDAFSVKISLADYWYYVEHGRGPGKFPPPPAIKNWIEIKPVNPLPGVNGKTPTVEQLAFLIGRKIANEGTTPHPFFEPAKEQVLREMGDAIDQAIDDDIADFIQEAVIRKMEKTFGGK